MGVRSERSKRLHSRIQRTNRVNPSSKKQAQEIPRCHWAKSELAIAYHDREWGVPTHDDRTLFEFLILEGAQAGLSWEIILRKRDNYRAAFDNFDQHKVARYNPRKVENLLNNPAIIRHRLKNNSTVKQAQDHL